MKKILLLALVASLFLVGCTKLKEKDEGTTMEKIQKQLGEMKGYECTANMKRISNKGENLYEIKQYYDADGRYRMELLSPENVKGNYSVFDRENLCQYNPRVMGKVVKKISEGQQKNQLFLGEFMKNYMQSEGVSVETAAFDESRCTVLEAVIPGNNPNLATEKLWVDNESLKPVRFVIYDKNGKERYIIEYTEFTYNPSFPEDTFKITTEDATGQ